MEKLIVDDSTGEVLSTLKDGDRIIRKESIDYLKSKDGRSFVKVDQDEGRLLLNELGMKERSMLLSLSYYVSYESGLIRFNNGKDITFGDIVRISGMGRSTAAETLQSLIDKDVLYKGKNSHSYQYFMNPWLFYKGKPNQTLKDMFCNYRIRSKGNILWKEL